MTEKVYALEKGIFPNTGSLLLNITNKLDAFIETLGHVKSYIPHEEQCVCKQWLGDIR